MGLIPEPGACLGREFCTSPNSGYGGASNVISYNDLVMGAWNVTYDTLNRMETGTATTGIYANQNLCWAYDAFGNRTAQAMQSGACPAQESSVTPTASYNGNNQVTLTTVNSGGWRTLGF